MPTITQLPEAASVEPGDRLLLDQGGQSLSLTTSLLLQETQPRLTLAQGALLGRVSPGSGAPEPVALGAGLLLQGDTLAIDPSLIGGAGTVTAASDVSASVVKATGSTVARSLGARAAQHLDPLDFGADPTGVADSAPAFLAAMATVPAGGAARLHVSRGTYRLGSPVNEPAGRLIAVSFDDGASLTGQGYLAVEKVESRQGAYRISQVSGGFAGYPAALGNAANVPFDYEIVQNTQANSGSARIGWSRYYSNSNRYSKYVGTIDFGEQSLFSWPRLLDNTSGWGHWEVVTGATYDEDTATRAQLSASAEHSEFDIVNNGPDYGWSYTSGIATPVQGMSMDPWGQNGAYGGHILYAYGTVGGFDGAAGGVNQRWVSYPAVHSLGNPPPVAQNSVITIGLDLTARAAATLTAGGGVASVSVSGGGGAYVSAPAVVFTGGGGSGAAATATLVGGAVVSVSVTLPGSGYASAPAVSFTGGGVAAPVPVSVTLNPDGAHGDLASVATAIRAASIPMVSAAVTVWGGAVSRLVVFGTAPGDLGTLTLGGGALAGLGLTSGSVVTPRDDTAVAFGSASGVAAGDQFEVNGRLVTVGGAGAPADIAAAINGLLLAGLVADVTAGGRPVMTAWLPQQPCGLVLDQPAGSTTLGKLSLTPGTILPPTPPKAFATAAGEIGAPSCAPGSAITLAATDLAGTLYGPVTVPVSGSVAGVAASLSAALQAHGWLSTGRAALTAAPSIIAVFTHNDTGGTAGLVIRNTAGGTLTLGNAAGTPLDTLGMVAGTYQPGGYSPGSQTVFHAAPNAIAPQGRGVFIGGSTVPDPTIWPHTPMEARGRFAHGLRTDRASFGDGNALLLGSGQAIGWGVGGPAVSASNGILTSTAPASLPGLSLTALPSSPDGLASGSVWNNGGVLSIV